mmetsp:Transcript_34034/g.81086  ORF Transcript_34034/g.81086 Transcript_34034/m.81086 type:complete len:160 (+) Transcript_34034:1648-2127(+)
MPEAVAACKEGWSFSGTTLLCKRCPARSDWIDCQCEPFSVGIGLLVRLHGLAGEELGDSWVRLAAAAAMVVQHVNTRSSALVPDAATLLPASFRLLIDFQDTRSSPSVSIGHSLAWVEQGRDVVVGVLPLGSHGPALARGVGVPHASALVRGHSVVARG